MEWSIREGFLNFFNYNEFPTSLMRFEVTVVQWSRFGKLNSLITWVPNSIPGTVNAENELCIIYDGLGVLGSTPIFRCILPITTALQAYIGNIQYECLSSDYY